MQVSVAGLRRAAKNLAHNFSDPQKKVREATSNDPWGPSSTLMSEIADLTYNIEAFSQIMEMLWKRLNDHGKNWRHVYKSLVLLEYLIKTGSERVAQQCKENIFAIQTLKDFQHLEDNKDQGLNVREKAKQLVVLLSSEERLRNERTRALKARERFAQTVSGFGSSDDNTPTSPVFSSSHAFGDGPPNGYASTLRSRSNPELEQARPQTIGEEELQLQLALAMSKEEAEQEEKRQRSDEIRLQMALSQSEQEFKGPTPANKKETSALVDLLDVDLGGGGGEHLGAVGGVDPWAVVSDPWTAPVTQDPWSPPLITSTNADPWSSTTTPQVDPWDMEEDEFDTISKRVDPSPKQKKNPLEFLGENSSLVNLDNLLPSNLSASTTPVFGLSSSTPNPFGGGSLLTTGTASSGGTVNPFHLQNVVQKPSINEIREKQQQQQQIGGSLIPAHNNPWSPVKTLENPFLN